MALLFPLIFFGLMWVLLVRPQQQRVKAQRALVLSLEVGEEVVTAGGVIGRIVSLSDEEVELEVAPGMVLRFLRIAVNARAPEPAAPQPALPEPGGADEGGRE
ncbi:MAG TPA: preprotein translocase subunit YajC [Acidimicrobiales bacterium]|nr:preprotein translocase subunit YajC [Acidimicrobiales bacterium]